MQKNTFKIGDVVHTPEGTRMTIREVSGHKITCNWFVGTKLYQDEFDIKELTLD